jgi:phosphate transport system substrate-binding protein
MINSRIAKFLIAAASLLLLAGCNGPGAVPVRPGGSADSIMGGGSSFVYPVMNRWTYDYYKQTGVQVNYQSLGSSGGIKQFTVKTLQFGATDAPMNQEQLDAVGGPTLHIPVVMGAVALAYHLPGLTADLTLSGETIAGIYKGSINKWNDPAITKLNPGVDLPNKDIISVRRADGSGTTFIFAQFLAKKDPEWKDLIGIGSSLHWPHGSIGGKGNEGVAGLIKNTPYSLGYVELVYALQSKLKPAAVINQAGKAVVPSIKSVTAAAAELTTVPEDLRMDITDSPGENSYPIAGLTWIVAREKMDDPAQASALRKFLEYILSDERQDIADQMHYSRLPQTLLEPARAKVNQISGLH